MTTPSRRLVRNAARCNHCHIVIDSTHRHDYVSCECGKVAVDGGLEYIRRSGNPSDFTDLCAWTDDTPSPK